MSDINKFNIIFPMAGEGSRYNYKFKPFLQISDNKFIELALLHFSKYKNFIDTIYFIITLKQNTENNVDNVLKELFEEYNYKLIILDNKTNNQYETIYHALQKEKITGKAFLSDCDHSIDISPMIEYINNNDSNNYDLLIPTWDIQNDNKSRWGKIYVDIDTNEIIDSCEKNILDIPNTIDFGVIGSYFFKNIEDLLEYNFDSITSYIKQNISSKKLKHIPIINAEFFGEPETLNIAINNRRNKKTLFCDIDGTIIQHNAQPNYNNEILLEKTVEKINDFINNDYKIIFTTARSNKNKIKNMLDSLNIKYHDIITNLPSGTRVLINDIKPSSSFQLQSVAININRNQGIKDININKITNNDNIVEIFKGASFSKTYLIENNNNLFVRKIIYKNNNNKIHYNKLKLQVFNLKRFNCYCHNICPTIITEEDNDYYYYCDMNYLINYKEFYKFCSTNNDTNNKYNILSNLFNILEKEIYCMKKKCDDENWINKFLKNRINLESYCELSDNINKIINMDHIIINGIKCLGLKKLLEINYNKYNPKYLSPIHGDLTYENILYNNETNDIKLIDMDGGDFVDAKELDLGKLLQSEISKYELWSCDSNVIVKIDYKNNLLDTKEYFNTQKIDFIFKNYSAWKNILDIDNDNDLIKTGLFYLTLHCLRMIPYRFKVNEEQAIYAIKESIFWLNYII